MAISSFANVSSDYFTKNMRKLIGMLHKFLCRLVMSFLGVIRAINYCCNDGEGSSEEYDRLHYRWRHLSPNSNLLLQSTFCFTVKINTVTTFIYSAFLNLNTEKKEREQERRRRKRWGRRQERKGRGVKYTLKNIKIQKSKHKFYILMYILYHIFKTLYLTFVCRCKTSVIYQLWSSCLSGRCLMTARVAEACRTHAMFMI